MQGPTRSTSRRLRCSRVHARRQLCRGPRAALPPVNRSTASLSRWPPWFAAPPHRSPSPALGGSRVREAGPRPRARPRPSAGPALSLLLLGDNDPPGANGTGPIISHPELASGFPYHSLPCTFGLPLLENLQWLWGRLSSVSRTDLHSKWTNSSCTIIQTARIR